MKGLAHLSHFWKRRAMPSGSRFRRTSGMPIPVKDGVTWQEITVEGRRGQRQFRPVSDCPHGGRSAVNIAFIKSNDKWLPAGEEAIPQIAPAIAQVTFKITGKRIRSLSLRNADLRWD
jgi:hypothetical protein